MATIISRKRKDGVKYTALIRIKRNGKVVHSEFETFAKKSLAKDCAARRESELKLSGTFLFYAVQSFMMGRRNAYG